MIKHTALAAGAALLLATPAYAFHCPKDASAIDHALSVLNVSEDVKSKVQALRDQGMEQHGAGNHADAVNSLSEAMRTLLMATK